MEKDKAIQQLIDLIQANGITIADLMHPLSAPHKIDRVHVSGGRWIEDFTPQEWAARGEQAAHPSDTFEMEFDVPLAVGPDGSLWAWIGPGLEVLPNRA